MYNYINLAINLDVILREHVKKSSTTSAGFHILQYFHAMLYDLDMSIRYECVSKCLTFLTLNLRVLGYVLKIGYGHIKRLEHLFLLYIIQDLYLKTKHD